jgi:phage-related protein
MSHINAMRFKAGEPRPLIWRGTSKSDYMALPATVQREMGYALFLAQAGKRHATMAKHSKVLVAERSSK